MELTNVEGCHYPGFAILDFQAKLDDGTMGIGKDQENFVVTPFIRLLAQEGMYRSGESPGILAIHLGSPSLASD